MWVPPVDASIFRLDEHGDLRVGATRILVDLIVLAHREGWTNSRIVDSYPSLTSDDVTRVVDAYKRYPAEIDAYMQNRERLADEMQALIESNQRPQDEFRQELLERRRLMESSHASPR